MGIREWIFCLQLGQLIHTVGLSCDALCQIGLQLGLATPLVCHLRQYVVASKFLRIWAPGAPAFLSEEFSLPGYKLPESRYAALFFYWLRWNIPCFLKRCKTAMFLCNGSFVLAFDLWSVAKKYLKWKPVGVFLSSSSNKILFKVDLRYLCHMV